jgi:hypothetical protein
MDSELQEKHYTFRTIMTIIAMVRKALAQHASYGESEMEPLDDWDINVQLPALDASERLRMTQLGWTSVVGVRDHEIIAIAESSDKCDRRDLEIGYDPQPINQDSNADITTVHT